MLERMPPAPSVAWIEDLYRNSVISSISAGLNPPEGESTCEGYDLRKHRSYPTSQTVESMYDGHDYQVYESEFGSSMDFKDIKFVGRSRKRA